MNDKIILSKVGRNDILLRRHEAVKVTLTVC